MGRFLLAGLLGLMTAALVILAGGPRDFAAPAQAQEAAPAAGSAERDIALVAGWNLVGWGTDALAPDATAAIADAVTKLFDFNEAVQGFRFFGPTGPTVLNTLDTLRGGRGLWIFATAPTVWRAPAILSLLPQSLPLVAGFNLVVWHGPSDIAAADAFAPIAEVLVGAWAWDAPVQEFQNFRPGQFSFLSDLLTLQHGQALWVLTDAAATWTQPAGATAILAADSRFAAQVTPDSVIDPESVSVAQVDTSTVSAAFAGLDVVAAYEVRWNGPADSGLDVDYLNPAAVAAAQTGDESADAFTDPGLVLLIERDGEAMAVPDQRLFSDDSGDNIAGVLSPASAVLPARVAERDLRVSQSGDEFETVIIADVTRVFRIIQVEPEGTSVSISIGADTGVNLTVDNLSTKDMVNIRGRALASDGINIRELFSNIRTIDLLRAGRNDSLNPLRADFCVADGNAAITWIVTGTAPLAPSGRFADATRPFEVKRTVPILCLRPVVVFENKYLGAELDTHQYIVDIGTIDSVPDDSEFTPTWELTNLECGAPVTFPEPLEFGFLHKGCALQVETATNVNLTLTLEIEFLDGSIVTCTFNYSQGSFAFADQGRRVIDEPGSWTCDDLSGGSSAPGAAPP